MKAHSVLWKALLLVTLAGCKTPIQVNVPPAEQPQLQSVTLRGMRACTAMDVGGVQLLHECNTPLPTLTHTGWVLTPVRVPVSTMPGRDRLNSGVILRVTTPTLTELELAYYARSGIRHLLNRVPPGPGTPAKIIQGAANQTVEVAMSDNGTVRTWTIAVQMSSCSAWLPLEMVNVSRNGSSRSGPLRVDLIRPENERFCAESPAIGSGGGVLDRWDGGPGPSTPLPTGACPGGGSRQVFQFCEVCPPNAPQLAHYTALEACSQSEAMITMGYGPGSFRQQQCRISTTSSRQACEGP